MCPDAIPSPQTPLAERLGANLSAVRARIARAAERAGRDPDSVRLLAVTKYVGAPVAAVLAGLGAGELGESRIQELERKVAWFEGRGSRAPRPRWHLIGHLQRNKVRRAVRLAECLHSLDSLRLLEALERTAGEEGVRPRVYFEVLLAPGGPGAERAGQRTGGGGAQRTGFLPAELPELLLRARDLAHLEPVGLMCMAPVPESEPSAAADPDPLARQGAARAVFAELAALRARLLDNHAEVFAGGRIELSMGMSSDLEAAVAEGSDLVRIGSALFRGASETGAGAA